MQVVTLAALSCPCVMWVHTPMEFRKSFAVTAIVCACAGFGRKENNAAIAAAGGRNRNRVLSARKADKPRILVWILFFIVWMSARSCLVFPGMRKQKGVSAACLLRVNTAGREDAAGAERRLSLDVFDRSNTSGK